MPSTKRTLGALVTGMALVAAVYHLGYALLRPWDDSRHTIVHVGLGIVIVGLTQMMLREGPRRWLAALAVCGGGIGTAYLFFVADDLEMRFGLGLTEAQMLAGWACILAIVVLCWLEWGGTITVVGVSGLVYFFFGHLLPGPLRAAPFPSFDYAMTFLVSGAGSGIFGQITPISANIIFLFMLFGALLGSTGVTRLFLELGAWLGRLTQGGAAITCVVASSLFGTVTGATVANVAITGTFTIPTMRRQGIRGEHAGAIEAVASCGGQILPPVMGVGAFVMAAYLGVSYMTVAAMAVIPALLYYASVLIGVWILVRRAGHVEERTPVDLALIRATTPPFLIPLGVLVYFLVRGYSPGSAALYAIGALVAVTFARPSAWRSLSELRRTALSVIEGLIEGAKMGAGLAVVTGVISLVAQSLITTALGPKFASAVASLVSGNLLMGLLLLMMAALLLGCGLPTVAAYTMVAIMLIPAMNKLGVDPAAAHFFAYYFAVYAAVTPPVATAAIIASRIAGASFWGTAWASTRLMAGPLLLPFLFVYHQELLVFPPDPAAIALPLLAWLVGTVGFLALVYRHLIGPMTTLDCALAAAAGAAVVVWMTAGLMVMLPVAVAALLLLGTRQYLRSGPRVGRVPL